MKIKRKLFSLILALALVSLPILLYAAAATITSREQISMGNFTAVNGLVTLNSGDTIATGLSSVIFFTLTPTPEGGSTVTAHDYQYTASGGTVTVRLETDSLRYRFFAIGGP